jgi:hypothetical protein
MKNIMLVSAGSILLAGCMVIPPDNADRTLHGPRGTIGYHVNVESKPPGARIEADGNFVGYAPTNFVIYGDMDGTFHKFDSPVYVVRAYPAGPDQYAQSRSFGTGGSKGEDVIPRNLFFDLTTPAAEPPVQTSNSKSPNVSK